MDAVQYILDKYGIVIGAKQRMPLQIPNTGRYDLAALFYELGFRVGVELGVQEGEYSEILCKTNPRLKLYSIDAWKAYKGYTDFTRQDKLERFYTAALERLHKYPCVVMRRFGKDAVTFFRDDSLDFIYIDANHTYNALMEDINLWIPKIRKGGIISGHDYISRTEQWTADHAYGIIQATNQYTREHNIRPWFVLGRKEKVEGEIRDKARSWLWVK